jgi:hypothetical protein
MQYNFCRARKMACSNRKPSVHALPGIRFFRSHRKCEEPGGKDAGMSHAGRVRARGWARRRGGSRNWI